jgi:hypothetical protein
MVLMSFISSEPLSPQGSLSPSRLSTVNRYEVLKARRREEELVKQVEYFSSELKKHDKSKSLGINLFR